MFRLNWLVCGLFCASACSKSAGRYEKEPVPEKVALPPSPGTAAPSSAAPADDTRFHLRADEGTLTIDKVEGKVGAELVANLVVTPGSGLHIATDFPIKLTLTPPDGIRLAKVELTAGGRDKAVGDATALTEQRLGFAVSATAEKAGTYEIAGTFKFGICDQESCHPKRQPIAIAVAAN